MVVVGHSGFSGINGNVGGRSGYSGFAGHSGFSGINEGRNTLRTLKRIYNIVYGNDDDTLHINLEKNRAEVFPKNVMEAITDHPLYIDFVFLAKMKAHMSIQNITRRQGKTLKYKYCVVWYKILDKEKLLSVIVSKIVATELTS